MLNIFKFLIRILLILNITLFDFKILPEKYSFLLKEIVTRYNLNLVNLKDYLGILYTPTGFIGLIVAPLALYLVWELSGLNKKQPGAGKKYLHRFHKVTLSRAI